MALTRNAAALSNLTLFSSLLRVDLELEPAAQRMGQRQKDFGLQVLMAKA